jgi:hypothetical protein
MTARPFLLDKPENIVSFLENGMACVVFFPGARELTEDERKRIDAARVIRFFIYGFSDAPVPPGFSGTATLEDYSVESLGWAIRRSTYIHSKILQDWPPLGAPQALINALLDVDAKAGTDDHRCVVTVVADHQFVGHDDVLYRPAASQSVEKEAGR